ncbi:MAG: flagellar FliJ protein [Bacillus sp. (in: firmicutes)]|jgi:flagellar FliJ protein|nr:flagellar FliJ protein [Bacillus sp. (in: firmicutes)]
MTFQFAYKHILNIKEKEKDQAYSEFGLSLRKKEGLMEELYSLVQERDGCLRRWEQTQKISYVAEIQQRNDYLDHLNLKITKVEKHLAKIEEEITIKKEEFLAKKKDERTWHHLRDKSFDEYTQKQKKIEQDMLDEMATIRHYHQRVSL